MYLQPPISHSCGIMYLKLRISLMWYECISSHSCHTNIVWMYLQPAISHSCGMMYLLWPIPHPCGMDILTTTHGTPCGIAHIKWMITQASYTYIKLDGFMTMLPNQWGRWNWHPEPPRWDQWLFKNMPGFAKIWLMVAIQLLTLAQWVCAPTPHIYIALPHYSVSNNYIKIKDKMIINEMFAKYVMIFINQIKSLSHAITQTATMFHAKTC